MPSPKLNQYHAPDISLYKILTARQHASHSTCRTDTLSSVPSFSASSPPHPPSRNAGATPSPSVIVPLWLPPKASLITIGPSCWPCRQRTSTVRILSILCATTEQHFQRYTSIHAAWHVLTCGAGRPNFSCCQSSTGYQQTIAKAPVQAPHWWGRRYWVGWDHFHWYSLSTIPDRLW